MRLVKGIGIFMLNIAIIGAMGLFLNSRMENVLSFMDVTNTPYPLQLSLI